MKWLDAFSQGVLLGGLYAQYALGMALMFGVMRIVMAFQVKGGGLAWLWLLLARVARWP